MAQASTQPETTALMKADDLRKTATDAAGRVEAMTTAQFDRVETAIRRNPIAATGIAAGVGFFLAILARR
jgi:ElaB/YqjD/DUF883 family membrane-anchored ribosome-binding protein